MPTPVSRTATRSVTASASRATLSSDISTSPRGVTLQIAVRDTGIGIAPANQARIFSGFTQAEASTTRRFGGSGLGVAISQRLVALMGGELALDSALGKGSTFHFCLNFPVAVSDGADAAPKHRSSALRALVVDDNATAREVLQRMAQSLGWSVDAADSGIAEIGRASCRERVCT